MLPAISIIVVRRRAFRGDEQPSCPTFCTLYDREALAPSIEFSHSGRSTSLPLFVTSSGTWLANTISVNSIEPRLRYLDANHVDTPAGRLDGAVLVSPAKARLGTLEGVLVDPQRRQVRYYVVTRKRGLFLSRHYLLPLTATRLDRDRRTLEVDVEADEIPQLTEVDPDDLPRFSDDDLLTAMFHSNVS